MTTLKKGDQAPSFSLMDQDGKEVKLSDFKGEKVLLYFLPNPAKPEPTRGLGIPPQRAMIKTA